MTRRLFTGATVWAGASCTPRAGWLLVEDDRVAALGQTQPPPPADEVIDLTGSHVLPGFVDVHLHLSQAAWFPHGGDGMAWRSLAGGPATHRRRAGPGRTRPPGSGQYLRYAPRRALASGPGRARPGHAARC